MKEEIKTKGPGGRPADVINPMQYSINLGTQEREIISRLKGNQTLSGFVRIAIREQDSPDGKQLKVLNEKLKDAETKSHELELELKRNKTKNEIVSAEMNEKMERLREQHIMFGKSSNKAEIPEVNGAWIKQRCKDEGVNEMEFTTFLKTPLL